MSLDGIIIINKPQGITSFDVIRKLRKILKVKKMGHTGTLDPIATGVLPIFIGKATKDITRFLEGNKGYVAEMTLGIKTDTLDREGKIIEQKSPATPDLKQQLEQILSKYLGEIEQLPPMFSAVHHKGKRLYELARAGKTVERKPRKITIYSIKVIEITEEEYPKVKLEVLCSKGTYIRQLIADLGDDLGCGAHMSALTRTISVPFHIAQAFTLKAVEDLAKIGKIDTIIVDPKTL